MVVLMRHALLSVTLVLLISALTAGAAQRGAPPPPPEEPQVIEIAAERFSFYPSRIEVRAGTLLEFRLTSEDTAHGFHIVDTDVDVEIPKRARGTVAVRFRPEPGRYTFECSRVCGAGHAFMRGELVVTE
jgi:cytochrome c oxidase subunit 2